MITVHARNLRRNLPLKVIITLNSKLNSNLTRPETAVMFLVVNDAELTGSNALDEIIRKDRVATFGRLFQTGLMELRCMADLERHLRGQLGWSEMMKIVKPEFLTPCLLRLVALGHVEHVLLHILLHHIPRAAAET